jgi:hypothetical protein
MTTEIATQIISTTSHEIDRQIATAKEFPRSIEKFHRDATSLVTLDESVAEECIYSLPPRGDKKTPIEGASSRFAEIIASAWGNCRYGARVVDETKDFVVAQGVFHDLETNACATVDVQRRIVDSKGRRYGIDMIGVTANAACSIAIRNAILKGVPKALWKSVFEAAKRTAAGTEATLSKRRDAAVKLFEERGVKRAQLFAALNITGLEDMKLDHLVILRGYVNALNEGEVSVSDLFPSPRISAPSAPSAPAAPEPERPGGKSRTAKPPKGKPAGPRGRRTPLADDKVLPPFDTQEADAYLFDMSGRLGQCPSEKEIDELASEFESQARDRMTEAQVAYAYKLIDTAKTLLDDKGAAQ